MTLSDLYDGTLRRCFSFCFLLVFFFFLGGGGVSHNVMNVLHDWIFVNNYTILHAT